MNLERLKTLMRYDPVTGVFTRLKCTALRHTVGEEVGSLTGDGKYLKCRVDGKEYYMHRLAILYMTGRMPEGYVDHIDHNGLNNIWDNLREVCHKGNLQNMSKSKKNTSGITGVSFDTNRQKWIAQIYTDGKTRMKRFSTKFGAIRQRILWNKELKFHENHGK